jgi:hypothetical protein
MTNQEEGTFWLGATAIAVLLGVLFDPATCAGEACERVSPAVVTAIDLFKNPTDTKPLRLIDPSLIKSACILDNQRGRYKIEFNGRSVWVSITQFRKSTPEDLQPLRLPPPSTPAAPVAKGNPPPAPSTATGEAFPDDVRAGVPAARELDRAIRVSPTGIPAGAR